MGKNASIGNDRLRPSRHAVAAGIAIAAAIAVGGALSLNSRASPIRSDETVWFFPTSAVQSPDAAWELAVHAWVFEMEGGFLTDQAAIDWSSRAVQRSIDDLLDSEQIDVGDDVFRDRIRFFTPLLDNERRKDIELRIDDQIVELAPTDSNGHVYDTVRYAGDAQPGSWLTFSSDHPEGEIGGAIQLIPATGRSVISDIDDTIKVSDVLDKGALLANTFVNPYRAVDGMPELFRESLGSRYFHYVSASPWRLHPALAPFLSQFPAGAVYLRHLRIQDRSFIDFLGSSAEYKVETIADIIERYPGHRFTLIGDAGEHDPEVYAAIYSRYTDNVERILIRNITGADWTAARFAETFPYLPADRWIFFDDPEAIDPRWLAE